ncbi:hypothetical protein BS78_02G265200 [Paspalum vaginatum]|nr:hypothetical protein BS78_02G265200 [Paspalum vaginatum]KAJ1290694.1 hypothetical protein BS78_02G265200 [Paspalum vaginatum]
MPAGDNPHSISEKKAALRESPKQPKHVFKEQSKTPFPKDTVATTATVGIKRPQPYGPLSPTNRHTLGNPGANGHLVYVRRRPETDQSKGGTSIRGESAGSIGLKTAVIGSSQSQALNLKHQNNTPQTQSAPQFVFPAAGSPDLQSAVLPAHHSVGKQSPGKDGAQSANDATSLPPHNVVSSIPVLQSSVAANLRSSSILATNAASCGAISAANLASSDPISATTLAPNQAHPRRSSNQDWSDRFLRLQAFLRNNEQSGQEEYISMLRSLSSTGRSKHAIELEKRAANLLIEEGGTRWHYIKKKTGTQIHLEEDLNLSGLDVYPHQSKASTN